MGSLQSPHQFAQRYIHSAERNANDGDGNGNVNVNTRYVQQSFVYDVCVVVYVSQIAAKSTVKSFRMFTFQFSIALHTERCAQNTTTHHSGHICCLFALLFCSLLLFSFLKFKKKKITEYLQSVCRIQKCIRLPSFFFFNSLLRNPNRSNQNNGIFNDYDGFPSIKSNIYTRTNIFNSKKIFIPETMPF